MQSVIQRKNIQNINRINNIIGQYEAKLDNRVNQVINEMISYTKKNSDPPLLPIFDKKAESQKNVQRQTTHKHRNKSSSQYSELSFLTDTSLEAQVNQLKSTFKQTQSNKIIHNPGRQIGNRHFIKPKFTKKIPEILPKEIRLNPLHERNAIKAYQLDSGLLTLIQKGRIGKDVNIITAFQKGRPILQAQKAIFHEGEERFAQIQLEKSRTLQNVTDKRNIKKAIDYNNSNNFDDSWALTMPKDGDFGSNIQRSQGEKSKEERIKSLAVSFNQKYHIKIVHYKFQQDNNFKGLTTKYLQYKSQIIQILNDIGKLMSKYMVQIAYVDSSRLLEFVTKAKRLNKSELLGCIVGYDKTNSFISFKNLKGLKQKYMLAADKVKSSFRFFIQRREFLKYLQKKMIANRIYGWAVSRWIVKKHRQRVIKKNNTMDEHYVQLQRTFNDKYSKIQAERHYQIHLANQMCIGKQKYKQVMNIQITKIFNIKNINKYIVYLLPYALDQQTINYYYKIMELQEIPNYKERVSFLEIDSAHQFKDTLNLSQKLYYSSSSLRKLKKKIRDYPAYFVVSYPSLINIKLSSYLSIPILSGNLHATLPLERRTSLSQFNVQVTDRYIINNDHHLNLTTLSNQIQQFCFNNKKTNKFVIKINHKHKSKGIALLTYPFSSLPEMYSNTTIIAQESDIDQYYHTLLKNGGIVQKYEEGTDCISVVLQIQVNKEVRVIGTFEKLSSGFVNIGYIFPQKKVDYRVLVQKSLVVCQKLINNNHFGTVQLTFLVTDLQDIYLQKVQCYLTHLGSALYYYTFLSDGVFGQNGDFMAKIVDTFEQDGRQEEVVTHQPRSFCYIPYLLHFGLSERQTTSFFQLCRMGGVSFDLQNKYGATFILLGTLKTSMGLITTAKDKKGANKLMLKSLQFIIKQNSHNMSNQTLIEKQVRMRERQNIINIKQRLQQL